jgi:hypothetical protein
MLTLSSDKINAPNVFEHFQQVYATAAPHTIADYYDHRFTQVRTMGLARSNVTGCADTGRVGQGIYECSRLKVIPDSMITREANSTILGFSLKDSVKAAFGQYYAATPFVIPSERIDIRYFTTGPTGAGLNCAITIPIIKGKEVVGLFPRSANDLTVMRNPEYKHLMFTMLNRNFPQKGADTNSASFYRLELESCNLDTILTPTESFENSYLQKVGKTAPSRQRSQADDTDFVFLFNLERQSSNAFFSDPVDSQNETVQLTGTPQTQGFGGDTYYYLAAESDTDQTQVNTTCPILAIVSGSFWLFSAGQKAIYETNSGWNETLAKYFPSVLSRLS